MKTKVVMAILGTAVLSGAVYCFALRNLNKGFQKADSQAPQAFQDLLEAAGGRFATGATGSEGIEATPGTENFFNPPTHVGQGLVEYYQRHPGEFERDKRYFETYLSAFAIARTMQAGEQTVNRWTASTDLKWISPSNRTDPWGHPFCVRSSPQRIVVVSPGMQASGPLDCQTLDLPEKDLAKMASARLNVQASGALVFVLSVQSPGSGT